MTDNLVIRLLAVLFLLLTAAHGTDPYPRNEVIDVLHYTFAIAVNDSTDVITGNCTVTVRFRKSSNNFHLNLVSLDHAGKGMNVIGVTSSGNPVKFTHASDLLTMYMDQSPAAGDSKDFAISYQGIPRDGLAIGRNKFGDRTFFGDNWPDRGQHWLPCIDHPYDKATVDFEVTAPDHYQVVATGKLVEEQSISAKRKVTRWHEKEPVPIKVVTIGVARFAVTQSGLVGDVPVTTWVFPQNKDKGFSDFAIAPEALRFFESYIGPYPYEKLAHVQSSTRWGALENASNIFYFEDVVNGKNERETVIAHETAHQWFGDAASENDWHHVWLSEGFATYMAGMFGEFVHGEDHLRRYMQDARREVIKFSRKNNTPVVDTTIVQIGDVLSTNTYQKAAWVLHMLRRRVGDDLFKRGLQTYYDRFKQGNASTADFQTVMEAVSGQDLDNFFAQWLFRAGHPRLQMTWTYTDGVLLISCLQLQPPLTFPLEIAISFTDGWVLKEKLNIDAARCDFRIPARSKPSDIQLDPGVNLLFEAEIRPFR